MKNIGLVFVGGGGKGAYHIGVWKALRKLHLDRNVKAVAGTSVGALNAVLFVQGNLELAEYVWETISVEKILTPDKQRLLNLASQLIPKAYFRSFMALANQAFEQGWFSRAGLLQLIRNYVHWPYVLQKGIPCYATCSRLPFMQPEDFLLNDCDQGKMEAVLLATSAIPIIFEPVTIDGAKYSDRGIWGGDNMPVEPLRKIGCETIVVVHLKREEVQKFPHLNIIEIVPQESLGGILSTLDFTAEGAKKRMAQGYEDALKILVPTLNTDAGKRVPKRKDERS
jgi:NTE family protein